MSARTPWRVKAVWHQSGGLGALEEVREALGLDTPNPRELHLTIDGANVRVAGKYQLDSDQKPEQATGVVLEVFFEGPAQQRLDSDPPKLVLRREHAADQLDKENGLTRELQLGDPEFDPSVYIDNDSTEADARRVLSRPQTREAVLRLLDTGHFVVITHRVVRVTQDLRGPHANAADVLDALRELLIIAKGGGLRERRPERRGETLNVLLFIAAGVVVVPVLLVARRADMKLLHILIALGAGFASVFLSRPLLAAAASGDSGSSGRVAQMSIAVFAFVAAVVLGLLTWL